MVNMQNTVISSRIRLARNINSLPFPSKIRGNEPALKNLYAKVKETCDTKFANRMFYLHDLSNRQANVLIENHLISPNLLNNEFGAALISDDKTISIMINEEDHLREQCILSGYRLDEAYTVIDGVDEALRSKLDIAFKMPFGHLTSCPTNLGAGMRASVMMFLPALGLNRTIDILMRKIGERGATVRGVYGEGSTTDGYMYQISNQSAVGMSEEEIIETVKRESARLCEMEEQARRSLMANKGIELEDLIMRAYGTLLFAMKISSKEFMNNIAMVKLGVSYGLIDQDIAALDKLIVDTQKNTMVYNAKKDLSENEICILRARTVKERLTSKNR